jgi:hypothetical protein
MEASQHWYIQDVGAVRLEVETKQHDQLIRALDHPGVIRVDEQTFAVDGPTASEAFRQLWSACLTALGELPHWLR